MLDSAFSEVIRSPSLLGSSLQDSPSLAGWGKAAIPRHLGDCNE